jgi:cell shape-determining protein MreD
MKSASAVFLLGIAALIVQGALARALPPPWCPDLAWLVVVGIGLRWPNVVSGAVLVVLLGYSMDLVSGSLMGQHAFLRLMTFSAAAVLARQLDLSGALSVGTFVLLMTLVYGIATVTILSVLLGVSWIGVDSLGVGLAHAVVNVVAAGPVVRVVERILGRFSEEEVGRRSAMPLGFDRGGLA